MKVLLAGCGGLIGKRLIQQLEAAGHTTLRLVRPTSDDPDGIPWDPEAGMLDPDHLSDCDAVVNLGGANIGDRAWSPAFKKVILNSRTKGTGLISTTLAGMKHPPKVFLCASAIGIYGDRGDKLVDETTATGDGFLADVVDQWEQACKPAVDAGVRVVNGRIGVVLAPDGGALGKMLLPFRLGLGGRVGNGRQYMSWISVRDVVDALVFCLTNDGVRGPVNMVSPHPVTNQAFSKSLAKALRRPAFFPVPGWAVSTAFGEMGRTLLLGSTRVSSKKLQDAGFQFKDHHLDDALTHLL